MSITTLPRNYRWFRAQGIAATEAHYLASAENLADDFGWYVTWEHDGDDCADGDETPETREMAVLWADDENGDRESLAAVGSIGDATDDYRRIIAAELALAALAELPA